MFNVEGDIKNFIWDKNESLIDAPLSEEGIK